MSEKRRKYDPEFREGAARIVRETGKPIAHVANDLGINSGDVGIMVKKDRIEHRRSSSMIRFASTPIG